LNKSETSQLIKANLKGIFSQTNFPPNLFCWMKLIHFILSPLAELWEQFFKLQEFSLLIIRNPDVQSSQLLHDIIPELPNQSSRKREVCSSVKFMVFVHCDNVPKVHSCIYRKCLLWRCHRDVDSISIPPINIYKIHLCLFVFHL
jgi:hypothetical protein